MKMNKNQEVVLDYLKHDDAVGAYPSGSIVRLDRLHPEGAFEAFCELNKTEEFEVLAEFAKWGLENE